LSSLPEPEPIQDEPKQPDACRLQRDAVDSAAHQLDNILLLLEARLQALWDCQHGQTLQDMAADGYSKHPHSNADETRALTTSTMLHQTRQAWERLKQQIGGTDGVVEAINQPAEGIEPRREN